ncbi:hypothetical protein ABG768_011637 [Culter alburnus]|uniref:Ig-like domain-containing protein n=1 Tax=Culter alburnus TaxID=194366 RepID=A0AAW1Z8Z4_CULAL
MCRHEPQGLIWICLCIHVKCQVIANHVSDSGQLRTLERRENHCVDYFDYWGKGTKVTVSSGQTSAPKSIFGLSQCSSDTEFLTIGCVSGGFSPADSLTFTWKDPANKTLTDFVHYPAFGSAGDYTKISHMRVKKNDWKAKTSYKCGASNSMGTVEATITRPDEKTPNVTIYRPDSNKDTDHVSLVCEVTSPKLGDVYIMWKVGEKSIDATTSVPIHRKSSTSVLSILTMSKQEYEDSRTTITCAVKHAKKGNISAPLQVSTSQREPPEPEKGFALNCNNDVLEEDEFRSLWSTATSFIFLFLFSLTYSAVLSLLRLKQ